MRKIIDDVEEGLESLLGENVALWCSNYIYAGKLVGVNDTVAKLSEAHIVYETGGLCDKEWKDAQPLPGDWYIQICSVESFGKTK